MRQFRHFSVFGVGLVVGLSLLVTPSAVAKTKAKGKSASKAKVTKQKAGKVKVTWLGHAAFEIVSPGGTTLLVDPFLTKNPKTPKKFKDLSRYKPDAILLSHSHFDHVADAEALAQKNPKAKVIGAFDHISTLKLAKDQGAGGNAGGFFKVGDVKVHLVPALHSSTPGGRPLGFIMEFENGRKIYHSGDTFIFGDMALIQEIHAPDVLLLQAGGGPYNQDPSTAALAVNKYFKPKTIVPMHFGTFGVLAQEDEVKKAFSKDKRLRMMKPGEVAEF
jgi:L-ascorbate metabolism protein UlaG (beta-lactamase superfamily)